MTVLVLASASPARLSTLRAAGVDPRVVVSGVDETVVSGLAPGDLALRLAELKCDAVAGDHRRGAGPGLRLGARAGRQALGKPDDAAEAVRRWEAMRGRSGVLRTGHCLRDTAAGTRASATASTVVHFADVTDAEIAAYVATGEPLQVAGAFTVDGLGGAFVTGIEGDHHNVVGLSLPLLRDLLPSSATPGPTSGREPSGAGLGRVRVDLRVQRLRLRPDQLGHVHRLAEDEPTEQVEPRRLAEQRTHDVAAMLSATGSVR